MTKSIMRRPNETASTDAYALTLFVDRDGLPTFTGATVEDHVTAWHTVYASQSRHFWALAAIAASLDKKCGARTDLTGKQTDVQRFCAEVGVSRTHFSYLALTHRTFSQPRNTGIAGLVASPELKFKHFLVAARFASDPDAAVAAVAEAHDERLSANKLAERLLHNRAEHPRLLPAATPVVQPAVSPVQTETTSKTWAERMASDPSLRAFVEAEAARVAIELDTVQYNRDHWHRLALHWNAFATDLRKRVLALEQRDLNAQVRALQDALRRHELLAESVANSVGVASEALP